MQSTVRQKSISDEEYTERLRADCDGKKVSAPKQTSSAPTKHDLISLVPILLNSINYASIFPFYVYQQHLFFCSR